MSTPEGLVRVRLVEVGLKISSVQRHRREEMNQLHTSLMYAPLLGASWVKAST